MALHQFKKGELGYWLGVIAAKQGGEESGEAVPQRFIDALLTLRCIEVGPAGELVVTDKGRLALHMEHGGLYGAS
ncbi:hypothetical protein [Bordetella genomosp. 9]|uniref:Uncharacterized protein n=1 Tax=Bordetella genomosp. 9 TaxID=1416803 RepID=A0A1W6Z2M6_9BORD|nr:hypothetical protein [Bordetella genomosp. 9]ARP87083.1 hypothetical protein CAL13_13340 [Bordetella genomosp. 9]